MPFSPPRFLLVTVLAVLLAVAGCGGKEDSEVLRLRIADQFDLLRTVLVSAGVDRPAGHDIQWSNFVGGPNIIAATIGGSVDVGWMAATPLVFAQAAGSPVKVIAAVEAANDRTSTFSLVVASDSEIRSIADLKGKNVFHLPGTQSQYFLFKLLEQEGLSLDDIVTVSAQAGAGSAPALLANGRIDAAVMNDPLRVIGEEPGI